MNYISDPGINPSKYTLVYNHKKLIEYVPSARTHHLDALEAIGLLESLTIDQAVEVVIIAQAAYRQGQADMGAEKIDNDAIWVNGIGGLEKQTDGNWKLTMPDESIEKSFAAAQAASILGTIGGSVKSERKAKSSAENGKLGGRPRRKS